MNEINKYGIGFWSGGFVYSLVNLIINIKLGNNLVSYYNCGITGVAVIGLILNIILLKRRKDGK